MTSGAVTTIVHALEEEDGIASVVDGRSSVTGKLKETGQRLFAAHTRTHPAWADTNTSLCDYGFK